MSAFRPSPTFMKMWPVLRGNLWHTTDGLGYSGIIASGAILPSGSGVKTNSGYANGNTLARKLGAVALFDFKSDTERQAKSEAYKWEYYLTNDGRILLRIEPALRPALIANEEWTNHRGWQSCPFVEVWHRGQIPIAQVTAAILVHRKGGPQLLWTGSPPSTPPK